MNAQAAEKFLQDKLDMIQNEPEHIQQAASILVNGDESTDEELEQSLNEAFGNRFHVSAMVKEWSEYARITYMRLQIVKNLDFTSVAMLNATIFVHSFVEKFMK